MAYRKRSRSAYGRRRFARRSVSTRRRWTSRSRKLYNPRGTNPNQVIELKNVDYAVKDAMYVANTDLSYPITFANASYSPTRVVNGDTAIAVAAETPWNFVSQGSQSNQREGRKINCVRMLLKGSIFVNPGSVAFSSAGSVIHCIVLLDTACNGAVPDLKNVFTSFGDTGDVAANEAWVSRHFFPSPNGVNRFRVLKHKIIRPKSEAVMVATTPTLGVYSASSDFSFSIDLKGLPVTFQQGAFTTPGTANVTAVIDNAVYVLIFRGANYVNDVPNFSAAVYGRLLYTG